MVRSFAQRQADTLRRLHHDANVWIATVSADGEPHLVPLSLAWDGQQLMVATPMSTATARNAARSGTARAALDSTVDVVLIDAIATVADIRTADPGVADAFAGRVGWDPRAEPDEWALISLRPWRVQAWNSLAENAQRTIMRDGVWVGTP